MTTSLMPMSLTQADGARKTGHTSLLHSCPSALDREHATVRHAFPHPHKLKPLGVASYVIVCMYRVTIVAACSYVYKVVVLTCASLYETLTIVNTDALVTILYGGYQSDSAAMHVYSLQEEDLLNWNLSFSLQK